MRLSNYQQSEAKRINLQSLIEADEKGNALARKVRAENIRRVALAQRNRGSNF